MALKFLRFEMVDVTVLAEYIGIAAAALSGFYVGAKKSCDWLGLLVAAFLTALGGGLMRDAIASRPPYAFTEFLPCVIVFLVIVICICLKLHQKSDLESKFLFILSDSIGLVSFTLAGAMVGLASNFNIFGVIGLGVCTGVGGGALRDIVLNEIPWFLRTGLYATVSIVVAFLYFVFDYFKFNEMLFFWSIFIFGVVFRLLAYYRNWHLPVME